MLSKMVIFPDIMWNSMTFFINFAKCQNFPDTLQNSLTIPWPWQILFLPDISLTAMNPATELIMRDHFYMGLIIKPSLDLSWIS